MRFLLRVFVVFSLVGAALGQSPLPDAEHPVRISELTIESSSLPTADRDRIVHLFREKTYLEGEIGERIRQALRNEGYFKAEVDEPKFSFATHSNKDVANVMVEVNPGSQYSLGEIYFRRTAAFPSQQLRNLFSMRRGDLFNGSKFGEGLGNLQKLYASRGCINMVAAPGVRIDESKHILDIFLDVDEGQVETGQTGRR